MIGQTGTGVVATAIVNVLKDCRLIPTKAAVTTNKPSDEKTVITFAVVQSLKKLLKVVCGLMEILFVEIRTVGNKLLIATVHLPPNDVHPLEHTIIYEKIPPCCHRHKNRRSATLDTIRRSLKDTFVSVLLSLGVTKGFDRDAHVAKVVY
uniref:Uncharacterized protein n=1 Tax=Glossina pallidipes TaxID=7398 RepID=A0A1A9ZMG5_GLOPL